MYVNNGNQIHNGYFDLFLVFFIVYVRIAIG